MQGWSGNASLQGRPLPPRLAFDDLRPLPELIATLRAIAQQDCALATGHLSADEVMRLAPLAAEIGLRRIVLTHPHSPAIKLSDDRQRKLIRKTSPERVLLSAGFGQVNSDPYPEGSVRYAMERGARLDGMVSRADFLAMFSDNGRPALGPG